MARFFHPSKEKRHLRATTALAALLVAGALASCGDDPEPTTSSARPSHQPETSTQRAPTTERPEANLAPPPCPDLGNCERASGTIAYVERVDPDGDGDAHFVLLSSESVTAPGITIVDVRRDLRPHPLPGIGKELAAAGPVYPGSRGQLQIEAIEVRVAP
jgi:hypothetical protein